MGLIAPKVVPCPAETSLNLVCDHEPADFTHPGAAMAREPSVVETARIRDLIDETRKVQRSSPGTDSNAEIAVWTVAAQVLLASAEFRYVE